MVRFDFKEKPPSTPSSSSSSNKSKKSSDKTKETAKEPLQTVNEEAPAPPKREPKVLIPVDLIILRKTQYGYCNELLLNAPAGKIMDMSDSRLDDIDFTSPQRWNLGLLQHLSRLHGLPIEPPHEIGNRESLREVLMDQLRRQQERELRFPKPLYCHCYLPKWQEGLDPTQMENSFRWEVRQKLEQTGDFDELKEKKFEFYVSDGEPGKTLNLRRWGAEGGYVSPPGIWRTMYWIEGGMRTPPQEEMEWRSTKTQADEKGWTGLKSKRAPSPVRNVASSDQPLLERKNESQEARGKKRKKEKKPPRDSGVGMENEGEGEGEGSAKKKSKKDNEGGEMVGIEEEDEAKDVNMPDV